MINDKPVPLENTLPDFEQKQAKVRNQATQSSAKNEKKVPIKPTNKDSEKIVEPYDSGITNMLEKRAHRRVTIELNAELIVNADTQGCITADLSAGGVKLKLPKSFFKNIRINIADSGEILGEIVWMDGDHIGIKFDEDQSEIINVLARVTI